MPWWVMGCGCQNTTVTCRGYWQSLSNVERELRAWMRVQRVQGALPTSAQLRETGAWSLMYAIRLHGPRKLAARLG